MLQPYLITNDREARDAKDIIAAIDVALTSEENFKKIADGLPITLVNGYRRALLTQRQDVLATLTAFEKSKEGDSTDLIKRAGADIGALLIAARVSKKLSQKDLARRAGLKEQQVQRYEADRYRSINLTGLRRIAQALGVILRASISENNDPWITSERLLIADYTSQDFKKIFRHAKEHDWFNQAQSDPESDAHEPLQRLISDHLLKFGSPALLRTGLNVADLSSDIMLVAWKARVAKRAEEVISEGIPAYREMDISWVKLLPQLSAFADGPLRAKELLRAHGIVLVVEQQIPGLKVDGAAFLIDGVPVIGLTVRRDTVDNFWYSLLHEAAHIVLHYRMGLAVGFFDDSEHTPLDEVEREADDFAQNLLIPDELWRRSPARIAKTTAPIEKFANGLNINSAIVYGRIQKERNNYSLFSEKIGRGEIRRLFQLKKMPTEQGENE